MSFSVKFSIHETFHQNISITITAGGKGARCCFFCCLFLTKNYIGNHTKQITFSFYARLNLILHRFLVLTLIASIPSKWEHSPRLNATAANSTVIGAKKGASVRAILPWIWIYLLGISNLAWWVNGCPGSSSYVGIWCCMKRDQGNSIIAYTSVFWVAVHLAVQSPLSSAVSSSALSLFFIFLPTVSTLQYHILKNESLPTKALACLKNIVCELIRLNLFIVIFFPEKPPKTSLSLNNFCFPGENPNSAFNFLLIITIPLIVTVSTIILLVYLKR